MKTFQLDILSPDSEIFSGEVKSVQAPGGDGLFQVLYNHVPLISTLAKGTVKIETDSGVKSFATEDGVIEVLNNKVIILVESAPEVQA